AVVARGGDDYNSSVPRLLHRLAQGIKSVALEDAAAQRKVNYPDVVLILQGNSLLNGRNNGAVGGRTVLAERPQVDEVGIRCDTPERYVTVTAGRDTSVACDDARNVCAVAVQVVGSIGRRIVVVAVKNAAALAAARLRQ